MGKGNDKPSKRAPAASPPARPPAPRPTPPAPPAETAAAEIDAAKLKRAETVPVVIIPPVDADTKLVMENDALRARIALLEKTLAQTVNDGRIDYTLIHNALHTK